MDQIDVTVIGAGVVGCAVARYLSQYKLRVLVIEKGEDVCCGASKANSGIVHAGFDAKPGSMMARMNLRGSRMMSQLSETLDFAYRNNGALVLCFEKERLGDLQQLLEQGVQNGVEGLKIITGDEARQLEPALSEKVAYALFAPASGIVCPFLMTVALAENAASNGVEFQFLTAAEDIVKQGDRFTVKTDRGDITTRFVVNAAGVYSDFFHNKVSENKLTVIPRRGEYLLLDREVGSLVSRTVFQLPDELGKGVLVSPTVDGNLLVGPNAQDIDDKEGTQTTASGIASVRERALKSVPSVPFRSVITTFAGLRPTEQGHDFILGEPGDCEGFFDAAGIQSPGLSAAPAIGEYLAELIADKAGAEKREDFIPTRKGFVDPSAMTDGERTALILERPEYGRIVCRCENVSEGQIIDAIRRTPGAVSLDGIKRRVRQGAGRCQAGFCTPRAMEILARELNIPTDKVTKNRPGSEILRGEQND